MEIEIGGREGRRATKIYYGAIDFAPLRWDPRCGKPPMLCLRTDYPFIVSNKGFGYVFGIDAVPEGMRL